MTRLLADENIHLDIVNALRSKGHDVTTVPEVGLIGEEDETVLEAANRGRRILLTGDKDFGGVLEMGPLIGKGKILLLRYRLVDSTRIVQELMAALASLDEEFSTTPGLLAVLSEGRCRIHRPPPPVGGD